jgi:hypothetical protein
VPFDNAKILKSHVPEATIEVYPGGGHDIIISQHAKMANDIILFLN